MTSGSTNSREAPVTGATTRERFFRELRWIWFGRKTWLFGIGFNLVIAVTWTLLTGSRKDGHISPAAVTAILGFVLSDPINTNQLGPESDRVIAQLRAGERLPMILLIKNLTLATVLIPIGVVITIVLRMFFSLDASVPGDALHTLWIVIGWLAIGNIVSMLLPFRTLGWRKRLKMKETWAWFAIGQIVPYVLYFAWSWTIGPSVHFVIHLFLDGKFSTNWVIGLSQVIVGILLVSLAYFLVGLYGRRRSDRLIANLSRIR